MEGISSTDIRQRRTLPQDKGVISFKNREIKVGKAFVSEYVALRKSQEDNIYEYIFVINY